MKPELMRMKNTGAIVLMTAVYADGVAFGTHLHPKLNHHCYGLQTRWNIADFELFDGTLTLSNTTSEATT